jgi:SAM-dependent methyltransferase
MTLSGGNRFEAFFSDEAYVLLKNHLYNYRLRRRAVQRQLQTEREGPILEVGCGLSPMTEASDRIVYSELSFQAVRTLKGGQDRGRFVVADAVHLPFKRASFSRVIASEVLEHLPEDRLALREIASVMTPGGALILTFPHRRAYFAVDDRFADHLRRYELAEMKTSLAEAGLKTIEVRKVLGPLEKITMMAVIMLILAWTRYRKEKRGGQGRKGAISYGPVPALFRWLNRLYSVPVRLDARLAPRCLSSVLLIRAVRER